MSSDSRQSPLPPPPQSPLVKLGVEKLKTQLDLEERLRLASEELLEVYKNSRQWQQVSQMAQTLSSNADRITCIQDCLASLTEFELPPPNPPLLPSPIAREQTKPIEPGETMMVEDPYDDFISVKPSTDEEGSPYWEIRSRKHTGGQTISRSSDDVSLLLSSMYKDSSNDKLLKDGVKSPDALRDILTNCLEGHSPGDVPLSLQRFLSPGVKNFSTQLPNTESMSNCGNKLGETCQAKPLPSANEETSTADIENLQSGSNTVPSFEQTDSHVPELQSAGCGFQTDSSTTESSDQYKTASESIGQSDDGVSDPDGIASPLDDSNERNECVSESSADTDLISDAQTHSACDSQSHSTSDPQSDSTTNPQPHSTTDSELFSTTDPTDDSQPHSTADPEPHSTDDPQPHSTDDPQPHSTDGSQPHSTDGSQPHSTSVEENDVTLTHPQFDSNVDNQSDSNIDLQYDSNKDAGSPDKRGSLSATSKEDISVSTTEIEPKSEPDSSDDSNPNSPNNTTITQDNITEHSDTVQDITMEQSVNPDTVEDVIHQKEEQDSPSTNTGHLEPQVQGLNEVPDGNNGERTGETEGNGLVQTINTVSLPVESVVTPIVDEGGDNNGGLDGEAELEEALKQLSPTKHGIKITNASHMFIKVSPLDDSASEREESPLARTQSDTDDAETTPTDNVTTDTPTDLTSSDIFSRSEEYSEDTDGKKGDGSSSTDNPGSTTESGSSNPSKSTFFVGQDRSSATQDSSPKYQRRAKAHSVFYSRGRGSTSPPPNDQQDKAKLKLKLKRSFKRTNKIRKDVSENPEVSLMAPQLATEWDPTCILEELYSDCRPIMTTQSSGGENCRYSGYLDKLPVNQSRPAVMKGWKHRYFRVTRGSLFYYDDDKAQKAISFVRLMDAKITLHIDSLKVEINEKNGNFIFLRAENKDEASALHRALQLESVHPTLTHRLSMSPTRPTPTVIIDLGSCSVRAGLISDGDDYPQLFFPNVCAFSGDSIIACGHDSLLPGTRGLSKLVYPRRHRSRMDSTISVRECLTATIEHVCKKLDIKPDKCNMLASVSPIMPEMEQQILAEVILETLGFQGLLIQEQTTLALYSYNSTTGISVSVGDSISVVPIIDGYKLEGADQHIPLGGVNVTENLSKLASAKDIRYFSDTEMYIVRHVKESLCFLSQDYFTDSETCDQAPHKYARAIDVDRFHLPDHKKVIALDLALFKAPEGLFQPAIWGKDVSGIQDMIHRAIEQCPIDMKRDMCRHIYLSGGTSLMTGFPERLKVELSKLFPRIEIIINADDNRYHAAYLGACVLASLNTFQKSLVTQEDWVSEGFEAFRKQ